MGNIVIEEKKSSILRLNLMSLSMTILCGVCCILGIRFHDTITKVVGAIGTLFFCLCTIYSFSRTLKSKPLLTITLEGIEDSSSASAVGFISFHDIKEFQIVNIYGQKMIGVIPRQMDSFVEKLPQLKQKAAKANIHLKLPPVTIRVDAAKDMTIEDIYTLLKKRLSDYSGLYD